MRSIFRSFVQAGFECSTHKLRDGRRLDLLDATRHSDLAVSDFASLRQYGISTVRTGSRWHLIEQSAGTYDFESLLVLLEAAQKADVELILDLMHFGWPDDLELFHSSFPIRFGKYVRALAGFVKPWLPVCKMFAPINEISFLSWAGGDVAALNPFEHGRGDELKRILVRSAVIASEILLNELPGIRLVSPEPVIHIAGDPDVPGDDFEAERFRLAQFEAWDMLSGRQMPELGGKPEYLDILGTNFYPRNQWVNDGKHLFPNDSAYRPFHQILAEVWSRYRRPIFVSETGAEGEARTTWFSYVSREVETAKRLGIPIYGLCLYPVLNHPGWDDDRHCHNGLLDYADASGNRAVYAPLAEAVIDYQKTLIRTSETHNERASIRRPDLFLSPSMEFRVPATSTHYEPLCTPPSGLLL